MESPSQDPLTHGLIYEDALPLIWRQLESIPGETQLARLNDSNEAFLRALSALEEHHPGYAELEDRFPIIRQELERLDLKLNLLMELVGHVLSRQMMLPEPVPVRVGAEGIEWRCERLPDRGSWVFVELYLRPRYPRPLELVGEVMERSDKEVKLAFIGMSESVQDWLEKLIFRHHRRHIARRRLS
jgi:hypothetical protein